MASGDFSILKSPFNTVPTVSWQTEAAATAILAGEPVKLKSAGSPYVIPLADDDLTIATDTVFIGIAASDSTQTASADGLVNVYLPLPGVIYKGEATTASNVNTAAKILLLQGDRVTMDLISSTYTIDENAGDNAANAFYIVGGDPVTGEVYFTIRSGASYLSL